MRRAISVGIRCLGASLQAFQFASGLGYRFRQNQLRRRYGVNRELRLGRFDAALGARLTRAAGRKVQWAQTSGSSGGSKQVPYNRWRLGWFKLSFVAMFARFCWAYSIRRSSLFVFSSADEGASLTSILLQERQAPRRLALLQAPYRVMTLPEVRELIGEYGLDAVRLWVLTISNPGVLYATNPSSIWSFLRRLDDDWLAVSRLIRAYCRDQPRFKPEVRAMAAQIHSQGAAGRLRQIAESSVPLPLGICVPAAEACLCWDGGQVGPFWRRLSELLPPPPFRCIPMYSMSTETIQTTSLFQPERVYSLALARGVYYEFLPEGAADRSELLLRPWQLDVGEAYSMVVSDAWGLRRYQTDDLFCCKGFWGSVPDLEFVGRRGLAYSFTGEKVTGRQVEMMIQELGRGGLRATGRDLISCFPYWAADGRLPHYKLAIISAGGKHFEASRSDYLKALADRAESGLCSLNSEYRSKRESGRLGAIEAIDLPFEKLPRVILGEPSAGWHSQFKFLAFYPKLVRRLP